jgi:purine-binding chemotaxis protein CheW
VDAIAGAGHILVFTIDDQKYAFQLTAVERIVRAVEVTPLPEAPAIVLGVINVHGRVLPVVDLRCRFRLAERAIDPDDQFIVAQSSTIAVALPVDATLGVVEDAAEERPAAAEIIPDVNYVDYVLSHDAEMIFVLDVDTVMTDDEERALADSLQGDAAAKS